MNDYNRIAKIIRYLDKSHIEQPDLAALAQRAGLSPSHFHRLFSNWAAITPKDFLQYLTLAHAKALLRRGQSVLDASIDAGLSSPGRLHDLTVSLEAASPGEMKSGGAGWVLYAGYADTPFGQCLLAESPRGICHLSFIESLNGKKEWEAMRAQWPQAEIQRDDQIAVRWTKLIFTQPDSKMTRPTLRAFVRGTPFQIRVWRALLQIQSGTLISYGQLATVVGNSGAARAVGTAVGQNALAFLIPCHRVIRETGAIGQYRWGSERKRAIIAWESAPRLPVSDELYEKVR